MTAKELAELAGVSPAAVSIVLNGRKGVSEQTRKAILELAEKYHVGTGKAKGELPNGSRTVLFLKFKKHGMLVEENQGFVSAIIDSLEENCRKRDCGLSIMQAVTFEKEELENIDFSLYCGVIVLGTELEREKFGLLDAIPLPFVVVDNGMRNWRCNAVGIANEENVHLVLNCFKELNFTEIGYFSSEIKIENFADRKNAFLIETKELGLNFKEENEFVLMPTLLGAYQSMERILEEGRQLPQCIFADNDIIAVGAMKCLKKHGYKIPEDISIAGFDDIPYAAINSPSLTTVRVQKEQLGKETVELLFRSMEDPSIRSVKVRVMGELVLRSSVKRA